MSLPISPVRPSQILESANGPALANKSSGFGDLLSQAVHHVNSAETKADTAAADFLTHNTGELHSAVLAAQNAQIDFELLMQVRNKVVSAYEEIMRMQI